MKIRSATLCAGLGLVFAVTTGSSWAAETIDVSLWDHPGVPMATDLPLGATLPDPAMAAMGITVSAATAPVGEITFNVTNDGDLIHEMIVIPVASATASLPYDPATLTVDEDAAGALGEVEELQPHTSGSLTLHLPSGTYVLICNVPGHYAGGMWAILTVQ